MKPMKLIQFGSIKEALDDYLEDDDEEEEE